MQRLFLNFFKIIKEEKIARRYFIMNSFDGILSVLGILFAAFFSSKFSSNLIIISGIGVGIAMFVSGIYGAYVTERAERKKDLIALEKHLIKKLDGTRIKKRQKALIFAIALIDGIAPLFNILVILFPFFLSRANIIPFFYAFIFSFIITAIALFSLGFFLAKIAKENVLLNGLKAIVAGIAIGLIIFLFEKIKII